MPLCVTPSSMNWTASAARIMPNTRAITWTSVCPRRRRGDARALQRLRGAQTARLSGR
jgi:hypothetical protein